MAAKTERDPRFEALIEHIHRHRGFDFRGYKRSSLRRRVEKRMGEVEVTSFEGYIDFLEAHPVEYTALLNTILINVTSFFRDPVAWKALETTVLPRLIEAKSVVDPIRVWSAGCASGEEPYSLAMLLVAALGEERFHRSVKIYATDLDEDALQSAGQASYDARGVEGVPAELLERCFEPGGAGFTFRRDLRKMVIFGRHNIVEDAPISNVDLLICRNVLIYLDSETQNRILPRLHYALVPRGHLFLGKAETLLARSTQFEPADIKNRIFIKSGVSTGQDPLIAMPQEDQTRAQTDDQGSRLLEAALSSSSVGHILMDNKGKLVLADAVARRLFGLIPADIGRPFQDLEVSFRSAELRGPIEEAVKSRKTIRIEEQIWRGRPDDTMLLTIEIVPLFDQNGGHDGTAIHFHDVTIVADLRRRLQEANEKLETTVEELRARGDALLIHRARTGAVLDGISAGVIAVDRRFCVTDWTRWCENSFGVRSEEALGQSLFAIEIGLPFNKIRRQLKTMLGGKTGDTDLQLYAVNRAGKPFICRVLVSAVKAVGDEIDGLVLVIENITETARSREALEMAIKVSPLGIVVTPFRSPCNRSSG